MSNEFEAKPALREQTALLIGLTGASGGGKTYSALELATGIVRVTGGEVVVIDTDNRRSLQYADLFKKPDGSPGYKHIGFNPPHSSLRYIDAIKAAIAQGAGCIIVDTLSHEHSGEGGMLDFQEAELSRMAGTDWKKREAMNMLAWAKPKAARNKLLREIQRLGVPTIFCFRAKQGVKPTKVPQEGGGFKNVVVQQGFTPIAGDEFVYEMTLNILLMPNSGGVATWDPEYPGEKIMTKLPEQFKSLKDRKTAIDKDLGERFAKWAVGGVTRPAHAPMPQDPETPADVPETGQGDEEIVQPPGDHADADRDQAEHRAKMDAREERLAERGFSGEGLAPAEDDGFPGDRPQDSAAGEAKEADRPASPAAESDKDPGSSATSASSTASAPGGAAQADFGFVDLANALANGKEWADLVAALQSLTKGETWKAAEPAMQARARAAVFVRLKELMKDGLRMDFTDDAHAFRCYIEFEPEGPTLRGNFGAFKLSPTYKGLPDGAKAAFEKAVTARLAITEPADGAAPIEGDFN